MLLNKTKEQGGTLGKSLHHQWDASQYSIMLKNYTKVEIKFCTEPFINVKFYR